MLAKFALAASTLVSLAAADVVPTGPTPGDSFNEGANCLIQYDVDTTGNWGNTTIDLMTGSNFDMVVVANVVTGLDGSTGGLINWECPAVTPNSQIYFYQYSAPGQATSWTGRFTIASATGESTEPTNSTTTAGVTVKYGYGALTDPSETIAAPSISGGVIGSASATASGSSAATSSGASSSASSSATSAAQSSSAQSSASDTSESMATVTSTQQSSSGGSSSSTASSVASSSASSSTPASGATSLQIGGALSALVGFVGMIALA